MWLNGSKITKDVEKLLNNGDELHLVNPNNVEGKVFRKFI